MFLIRKAILLIMTLGLGCQACHSTPALASEAERWIDSVPSQEMSVPGRWRLNAAGQLEFLHDPLGNGRDLVRKTHTVVLVDRAPKMCRARDRRHSWFFTEALLIESRPLSGASPSSATFNEDRP